MRGVMLEVPQSLLAERRRTGADKRDELWEGVLHMVPQPSSWHQELAGELFALLLSFAKTRGSKTLYEVALYGRDDDYRVPGISLFRPDQQSPRGIEGALFLIEVLSPGDESREKLPFYAARGVPEVLLIEPEQRTVELFTLRGTSYEPATPEAGELHSQLGISFARVLGPKLRVTTPGGTTLL